MTPSDEDLVRSFLAGDTPAFEELVRRHERRIYNLSLRMVGREEDARDATQDAFLTALRKLSSFRGDAAFTTWLHRVTVNACYDLLRKRGRAPITLEVPPEPVAPSIDPAEAASAGVDVRRALLRVREDFRTVLVMHDVQDLPYEEIAAVLEIPIGTVKSRLHRGRVALAEALGEPRGAAGPSEETP